MKPIVIDSVEYEAFKLTLPSAVRQEEFRWIKSRYDVTKALFIIHKHNLAPIKLEVVGWCQMLGMAGPKDEAGKNFNILNGVTDAQALRENIDPKIPIIVVEHTWGKGQHKEKAPLVIDGNKRLRKAFVEGQQDIDAYYLPEQIAKQIRI